MAKIRVCHVITRMIRGGAQKVVVELMKRIDGDRYESFLISGPQTGAEGSLLDEVGGRVEVIPDLRREIAPAGDLAALAKLTLALRRIGPHILHCHTYKAGILGCYAGKLAGVKGIVFSPHGHIFDAGSKIPGVPENGTKRALLYWITRSAQMCSDVVTALSPVDRESQVKLGLSPRSRYSVIPNGVDFPDRLPDERERIRLREDFGFSRNAPVLGCVGRLSFEKGHRYLISAVKELREYFPTVKLAVAGTGDEEGELRALTARLGLENHVVFLGYREEIFSFLSAIDIFVQPSLYEGQGIALIEAMGMGRPVVATRVGGVVDVVRHGVSGLLVAPAESGEIARAVRAIVGEPELARRLAREGRAYALANHAMESMVRGYESVYERLYGRD